MPTPVEIHPLVTMEMLRACERLQLQVWGYDDLEVVPAAQMRAALHAGALVAGAFVGRELVGFAYGFPALPHEDGLRGPGLHSHMMAVVPEARGLGAGRRLKWYQRRWCVEHGMDWATWTFDPLQARNARLNLHHLGAVVHEYQVDFYGVLGGALSGDLPTDRFVAIWDLTGPHVRAAAARDPFAAAFRLPEDGAATPAAQGPAADAAWALRRDETADDPCAPMLGVDAGAVWTAVPRDVNGLRRASPPRVLAWAEALRAAAVDLVARGYEVDAFVEGAYRWRTWGPISK
jgi:predicted GNAT superfamily acetyltransferase